MNEDSAWLATRSCNTPSCWRMHGEFLVEFRPPADISAFLAERRYRARIEGGAVRFGSVVIWQSFGRSDCLQFAPEGSEDFTAVPHGQIVGIWSGEGGLEWLNGGK